MYLILTSSRRDERSVAAYSIREVGVVNGTSSTGVRYTYVSPFGISGSLPLRLLHLSGRTQADGNHLEWLAGEDGELYRYDVQARQVTGWTTIGSKESGTTPGDRSYHYIHPSPGSATQVYRIAATELNTHETIYSNILMLDRGNGGRQAMSVYPNPATHQLSIQLPATNGIVMANIYTISGQVVLQTKETGNSFTMDIKRLPAGIYMLKVTDARSQWLQKITRL